MLTGSGNKPSLPSLPTAEPCFPQKGKGENPLKSSGVVEKQDLGGSTSWKRFMDTSQILIPEDERQEWDGSMEKCQDGVKEGGNPLKCSGSEIMRGIFSLGNGRKRGAAGRQRDSSLVLRLLEEFRHLRWGLMDPPVSGQADGCRTKQWLPTFGNSSRKSGNCSINSWSP